MKSVIFSIRVTTHSNVRIILKIDYYDNS